VIADPRVAAALATCIRTAGAPDAVAGLRQLIEEPLIERLTVITTDRGAIDDAVDEAFSRFAAAVASDTGVSWLVWIVAAAMTAAAETTRQLVWVDGLRRFGHAGNARDGRMLVFFVVLLMDGGCQWRLLECVSQPVKFMGAARCHRELIRRLRELA
jgi:hypothetical protein